MTARLIFKSWREIEDHVVPGAACRLSRSTVLRLVALGYLRLLARGPSGEVRVRADELDAAWLAREADRGPAREKFGRHRRGGLSDRLAAAVRAAAQPASRVARAARAAAQRQQLGLFEGDVK
jgi:hypothetical protein